MATTWHFYERRLTRHLGHRVTQRIGAARAEKLVACTLNKQSGDRAWEPAKMVCTLWISSLVCTGPVQRVSTADEGIPVDSRREHVTASP